MMNTVRIAVRRFGMHLQVINTESIFYLKEPLCILNKPDHSICIEKLFRLLEHLATPEPCFGWPVVKAMLDTWLPQVAAPDIMPEHIACMTSKVYNL